MPIEQLLASEQPAKWLFYGDSVTHGAFHTFGSRDYTELFSERVRWELRRCRDVVINTAASGNTSHDLLADFEWRVQQFYPQVVFIMIGANDCRRPNFEADTFATNLQELGDRVQAMNSIPVLQTTNLFAPGWTEVFAGQMEICMNQVRRVANKNDWLLVDHARYWGETSAALPTRHESWLDDELHPNLYGHRVLAECLFQALGIYDAAQPSGRLFHP